MSTPLRREVPMLRPCREPSLEDAMADPLIQALMLADGVDPDELRALMRGAARRIELGSYGPQSISMRAAPRRRSALRRWALRTRSPLSIVFRGPEALW